MAFIQNKDLSLIIKNAACNRQIQSRENPSQGAEMPQAKYQTPSIQGYHCILESLPHVSQSFPPMSVPYAMLLKTESHAQR